MLVAWPEDALAQVEPDHQTAVVVLTHDEKFDIPALKGALETEAFYIGALGSRRNQKLRRDRLLEAGRRRGATSTGSPARPASTSAPTRRPRPRSRSSARSSATRASRSGGPLRESAGRIHVEATA